MTFDPVIIYDTFLDTTAQTNGLHTGLERNETNVVNTDVWHEVSDYRGENMCSVYKYDNIFNVHNISGELCN